jgi:hypothetical protein
MVGTCIARYRDCTGSVIKYDFDYIDDNGIAKKGSITADKLKRMMAVGRIQVSNLKLNANNALLVVKGKDKVKPKDIWPPAR